MSRSPGALKVNPPLGRMPVLRLLRPAEIRVDAAYQRDLAAAASQVLVRRIAQHWNWDLCQPLTIARRQDLTERFFVIDGQHRLAAAKLRGDIEALPCVIVAYDSAAAEAASFLALNQQRRSLTRLDLFRAAVASENPQACAIMASLREAGLGVAPHMNARVWKPGVVSNIGGIESAWRLDGPEIATAALRALGLGFAGQVQRYCGTMFRAILRVCRDEFRASRSQGGGGFAGERFERFVEMLARESQERWMTAIKRRFSEAGEMFITEAADAVLREEWRRAIEPRGAPLQALPRFVGRRCGEPVAEAKGEGFGLGATDFKGDAEWAWCAQCDKRRTRGQVASCSSRFCKLKAMA